jgi:hypothetical protein
LTASLQLWHGLRCPSVSQGAKHRSDLWAFDRKPSDGRSLPVAYLATGMVADQPLTPSVALLSKGAPDPPPPPPRQKDDDFIEPERLPPSLCPFHLLSLGGEGQSKGVCNRYDSRARPGSPEPHFRAPEVALATRLDG